MKKQTYPPRKIRLKGIKTPWSLWFDRDGCDDVAVIWDGHAQDLVTSRGFWAPEDGQPVPGTLASMWLMVAAPNLLHTLMLTDRYLGRLDPDRRPEGFAELRETVRTAINAATTGPRSKHETKPVTLSRYEGE